MISTATKVNAKTTAKNKINQKGEVVSAVKTKEVCISKGVRVFATKSQLIALIKKGDPQYDIIDTMGNGFCFYGQVLEPDSQKGRWHVEFDLFPTDAKSLRLTHNILTTLRPSEDEPRHNKGNEKIDSAVANLEILDDLEVNNCDILLANSDNNFEDDIDDKEEIGDKQSQKRRRRRRE